MSHNITPLISLLFHSQTQAHIYHLQTDSYAAHKALNDYYDGIPDLLDSIVEAFQGEYGIQRGYKTQPFLEDNQPVNYFENILQQVELLRYKVCSKDNTPLQNEIDTVVLLIKTTLYKLKHLV